MDGAGKIAAGIVLAAVVAVAGYVGYNEFSRRLDIREAREFVQQLGEQGRQTAQQFQLQVQRNSRNTAEMQERARLARRLSLSERCIGGTVIQVNGSTYTQAIEPDGRPVACSGIYRLR